MKKFRQHRRNSHLQVFVFLFFCVWAVAARAQSVTWQFLPWSDDSSWLGAQGSQAVTNGSQITMTGHDVLSVQSFSGANTIAFDVSIGALTTSDGTFRFQIVPTGSPTNLIPAISLSLSAGFGNIPLGGNIEAGTNGTDLAGYPAAYNFTANTTYHEVVTIAANGQVGWSVNNQDMGLGSTLSVPYNSYQIRLISWQPTQVWTVDNFTVIPEPATMTLVGAGLVGLFAAIRRRKSS